MMRHCALYSCRKPLRRAMTEGATNFRRRIYCNLQCSATSRRHSPLNNRRCSGCGSRLRKNVDYGPAYNNRRLYCTKECAFKARKRSSSVRILDITKDCESCGRPLLPRKLEYPSAFLRRSCCSETCARKRANAIRHRARSKLGARCCSVCGGQFFRKYWEKDSQFLNRMTCGQTCSLELRKTERLRAIGVRYCARCGADLVRKASEPLGAFRARKHCGKLLCVSLRLKQKMCTRCGELFSIGNDESTSSFHYRKTCGGTCLNAYRPATAKALNSVCVAIGAEITLTQVALVTGYSKEHLSRNPHLICEETS